jgi:hypothetical protein
VDWVESLLGAAPGDVELCATAQLTDTSRISVNNNVLRIGEILQGELTVAQQP